MLELTLNNTTAVDDPFVTLDVSALQLGAVGDYGSKLYTTSGYFDEVVMANYPRWFESAGSLCGRFLRDYLSQYSNLELDLPAEIDSFTILVRIVPGARYDRARVLELYEVTRTIDGWNLEGQGRTLDIPNSGGSLITVAMNGLRTLAYGDAPFPVPVPLDVPVHIDGTLRYVLMREIPEPAQAAFRKNMHHSTRPHMAGGDAAFAWDWEDFLAGAR